MMTSIALCLALLAAVHGIWACPQGCDHCSQPDGFLNKTFPLVRAMCQHASQMTSVPQDLPENLRTLIFRSNGLKHITNVSLSKYPYLVELDFSNNQVKEIVNGAFQKQRNLLKLILQDNNLKRLSKGMFTGLHALEKLFLQKNYVSSLEKGAFEPLKSLRVLNLHDNNIMDLEAGTFEGLDFLRDLDLSGCLIKKLGPGAVGNLMSLHTINLSYNDIQIIHDDAFLCSPLISKLHLNSNSIKEIPVLHRLQFLQDLDVSENPISYIHIQSFSGNPKLQILNISFCNLTLLQKEIFAGHNLLQHISLQGNPFLCDCQMHWPRELLRKSALLFSNPHKIVCTSPLKLSGRPIKKVKRRDLKCNCNFCKKYASCRRPETQCKCTSGLEYETCDEICPAGSRLNRCDYVNEHCLCSKPTLTTSETWKCSFQMINQTCSKNAHLKKHKNSLRCACNEGFQGNGISCTDVDECEWSIPLCINQKTMCENTVGSYHCKCRRGYRVKHGTTQECVDVNECETRSICGENGFCHNTEGLYS